MEEVAWQGLLARLNRKSRSEVDPNYKKRLEYIESPTGSDIADILGNRNLNNIVDNEDSGSFDIDVYFDSLITQHYPGYDSLFFWERGKNSDLRIQALDASGNLVGNSLTLFRNEQTDAGFDIDTTEIGGPQPVGSWGVSLAELGVTELKGLKLTSEAVTFGGPDFKVVAKKTPEPGLMLGLGTVATVAFFRRRGKKTALNSAK
ncbi:MAG: PEP-CTERM sorting domain-containing protein [Sphaerospermopsis sp. SIO1G2]|nr:PEP-CTERM sorting domain-containing protein [Sphaerospermopsis sp. SIO1G2]